MINDFRPELARARRTKSETEQLEHAYSACVDAGRHLNEVLTDRRRDLSEMSVDHQYIAISSIALNLDPRAVESNVYDDMVAVAYDRVELLCKPDEAVATSKGDQVVFSSEYMKDIARGLFKESREISLSYVEKVTLSTDERRKVRSVAQTSPDHEVEEHSSVASALQELVEQQWSDSLTPMEVRGAAASEFRAFASRIKEGLVKAAEVVRRTHDFATTEIVEGPASDERAKVVLETFKRENKSPLLFWKSLSKVAPILSAVAMAVFAIPAGSAPSNSPSGSDEEEIARHIADMTVSKARNYLCLHSAGRREGVLQNFDNLWGVTPFRLRRHTSTDGELAEYGPDEEE
uniref:HAT C-terminal dimerisation domain-containing protein n=2 Tax=Palpitomonas bilix TaxID=652834 RepID=A0A7S3LVF3_9EUKA|mmetsp:Transcript_50091/g.128939  ORF Transcript_50091/g.128939 Transcript_50091/m.128939 type:complete len:348 (+) Transcript_50091:111-1154(+)